MVATAALPRLLGSVARRRDITESFGVREWVLT
jgi:hypothetical protein